MALQGRNKIPHSLSPCYIFHWRVNQGFNDDKVQNQLLNGYPIFLEMQCGHMFGIFEFLNWTKNNLDL